VIRFTDRIREGDENDACAELSDGYRTMIDRALAALVQAWITTTIAITLFVTAIALSRVWDSTIYLAGLRQALARDL
jgi:multisubunit Na+/H+ antiporter MnhC subunit